MRVEYDFNIRKVIEELKSIKVKRVLLQLPDGLKPYSLHLANQLKAAGFEALISSSPCYGGCDLAEMDALKVGADAIVHLGHYPFNQNTKPVKTIYEPVTIKFDLFELAEKIIEQIKRQGFTKVGLTANAQYVNWLGELAQILNSAGFSVFIDEKSKGLVLGCDASAALNINSLVDCFVLLASGDFHALGLVLHVDKPVILADPLKGGVKDARDLATRYKKLRWGAVLKAKSAKIFGVVLSLKSGQFDLGLASKIVSRIEGRGLKAYLITADEIKPDRLASFTEVEAYVIVGCPRIAIDNPEVFGKPLINAAEIDAVLSDP